jgi:anti-anti-sigma factor
MSAAKPSRSGAVFDYDVSVDGRIRTVRLTGEFDGAGAATIVPQISATTDGETVVLDASSITFVDSVGLRALVQWQRAVDAHHGTFLIRDPSEPLRRLLRATCLDESFQLIEDSPHC